MSLYNDFMNALQGIYDGYGTYDALSQIDQAKKNLGDACNNYLSEPTAENRAKIRSEYEKYRKERYDGTGGGLNNMFGRIGTLLDIFGINPFGDLIQGLGEKYNAGDANLDRAADMLRDLRQSEMSDIDRGRCEEAGDFFKRSRSAPPPRRDPLAIDLDGDGIETVAAAEGILFDHDADAIKTATGWVNGDDGWLVLDKNGNGHIDNGAELFGVDTVLANGQKATDGFQALAELDSNSDGMIDANDAAFQNLKVWRDIDQDGVSQSDELFKLTELGITSFNLIKTVVSQDLGNGNQVVATGSYTRSNGATASIVNLELLENRVDSEFVESIALTPEVQALPSMSGMGLVRNLSEAAMLSTSVLGALTQYSAATTVYEQQALLEQLVNAWAATAAAPSQGVQYEFAGIQRYVNGDPLAGETGAYKAMLGKLHALEIFNAESFAASGVTNLTLHADQVTLINQGYDALKAGVFDSLISQTLLKPYLQALAVVHDGTKVRMDYSGVLTLLDQRISAEPSAGIADLLVLYRQAGDFFMKSGWNIVGYLEQALAAHPADNNLTALLTLSGIKVGCAGNDSIFGDSENTTLFGAAGDDSLFGSAENDILVGGTGDDRLYGQASDDVLDGGTGNDYMEGSAGNDTYIFRRGAGFDTINTYDTVAGKIDTLVMEGLNPADIRLEKRGNILVLIDLVSGSGAFIQDFFVGSAYQLDRVTFADGTVWDRAALLAQVVEVFGGAGNDSLIGRNGGPNRIYGLDGNDNLFGGDGNDLLNGGTGTDNLYGYGG
ncbi:MAG TPA: calcium-binding protein, partial [Rhodocyclaceae bacterium]|nr:calcium-binding protein [Rhodocyclaceae bacterium]